MIEDVLFWVIIAIICIIIFWDLLLYPAFLFICSKFNNSASTYYIYPSDIDPTFKAQASDTLKNSNWHTYHFIKEVDNPVNADIHIHLAKRESLNKYHNNIEYYPSGKQIRWSITTQNVDKKPQIFIDEFNWLNGVSESGLSISDYRTYVVNHEFGHGLGYDHVPCNIITQMNGKCPVMYQSTRGCKNYKCGKEPIKSDLQARIDVAYLKHPY